MQDITAAKGQLDLQGLRGALGGVTELYDVLKELQDFFDASSGHVHTGAEDDAPAIANSGIAADAAIANTKLANPNSYFTVSFHCSRQLTASVTRLFAFQMPFAATAVEVSASARASGGTAPTLTIDVLEAGTTILTSPVSVTAGSNTVATPSDTAIADNAAITVNAVVGGTTPTWDDISVMITFKVAHTT
jgi:hypothetical protein